MEFGFWAENYKQWETSWCWRRFEVTRDAGEVSCDATAKHCPGTGRGVAAHPGNHCDGIAVDVRLESPCRKAIAYDPLNGVSQELSVTRSGESPLLKGVLVRDWPLVIRIFNP